jgi:hypothetical protein
MRVLLLSWPKEVGILNEYSGVERGWRCAVGACGLVQLRSRSHQFG